jgi:acetylornithine deacetylase/succinyl-diaminopimelate desuccinylase-like protein
MALVDELRTFVGFASVSAEPEVAGEVRRCAEWLAERLRRAGLERVRVINTARHPLVCAEWRHARGRPTALVYGHYDVQPADPVAAWRSPPFRGEVRGEHLIARGASDDKGQVLAHIVALEALLARHGVLPVNVVCVFEGEEEIGSPNLEALLRHLDSAADCDVAVVSDTTMMGPTRPAITYAARGSLAMRLTARGGHEELHAGRYGGIGADPAAALATMLAGLQGRDGRVAVSGFYDGVARISAAERTYLRRTGPSDEELRANVGPVPAPGPIGLSLYEQLTCEPALVVTGLSAGDVALRGQASLASTAGATLGFRLVADQDPEDAERLVRARIAHLTPPWVTGELERLAATRPVVLDVSHPVFAAARRAYRVGFGTSPVLLRSGGTVPIADTLQRLFGIPVLLAGFALPSDRPHAPNERVHLPTLSRAVVTCAQLWVELARTGNVARMPALSAQASRWSDRRQIDDRTPGRSQRSPS